MNCASFEGVSGDLVRDRLPAGPERDLAFAHAEACPRCALRLVDERALAADLRALALGTEREAPERVERALRAAFGESRVEIEPVASAPRLPSRRTPWLWGAAAVLVIAAGVVLRSPSESASTPPPPPEARSGARAPEPVSEETEASPRAAADPAPARRATPPRSARPARADDPRASAIFASLDGTDSVEGLESAHVVRVELPPSALAALGWPVPEDDDGATVRAEVVLAEDGVARAIRLVE